MRRGLKEIAYSKIYTRYKRLMDIKKSKIEQISNYIITHMGEVTPLALQKLLSFSEGVNYALNHNQMINEKSQAWQHGPVYPTIYAKYRKYGYKPIDDGISSTSGCMLSLVTSEERKAIDMVISTFGIYSPKTLETISHWQTPWREKRKGYDPNEAGKEVIEEEAIEEYYVKNQLNSEERIQKYIMYMIKNRIY